MQKKIIGKFGEDYCASKLCEQGYEILERNFHSRYGEIDIIAKHKHYIIFIEIKTRTKENIEQAQSSISTLKQKKLTKTAMYYLKDFPYTDELIEFRFDVIILQKENNEVFMKHFENAFSPAEVGDFFA